MFCFYIEVLTATACVCVYVLGWQVFILFELSPTANGNIAFNNIRPVLLCGVL